MSLNTAAIDAAISVYGEDAEEFVQLTLKDADKFVAGITSSLDQGDADAAGLAAHSLKSIMRQVGVTDVGMAAFEMEKAGKAGQADLCKAQLAPLRDAYAAARDYLIGFKSV